MARRKARILVAAASLAMAAGGSASPASAHSSGLSYGTPLQRTLATVADDNAPRTAEQQALVDFARGRFEAYGLELPKVHIQFHDSLEPCGLHKGFYLERTRSIHMCSVEKQTMLHEMAHAWALHNLNSDRRAAFTELRGLETWNDHDYSWKERATEHVAETIAWGLTDEPTHASWTEYRADGTAHVVSLLLSIDSDLDTVFESFYWLTGQYPLSRMADMAPVPSPPIFSPEAKGLTSG